MMKRRNGEIVIKRSSRYAKRQTKSYTGEHFLSSNYGTVLKMLTLFCIVLFGDYCLGNFRLEYIWPLWLCMNSMMDAYKMQGFGFAVFFIGIVVTSDIICFLLVPVRWLFLVASSYVWLQYVISSERGLCIQTVVLWILFVYVESCIRVRELNRFLGTGSPTAGVFSLSPTGSALWPDSTSSPPSDTSTHLFLNDTSSSNTDHPYGTQDGTVSTASAAASAASSTTLSRIADIGIGLNDSVSSAALSALTTNSSPTLWLFLWSFITSATPGFLASSSMPLRLELCRPLAAHCVGYPLIRLIGALKAFIAYRLKRSRQRQFAKENQLLKDLLLHALPDDVQQKQRSQLFSTFSVNHASSSINSSTCTASNNGFALLPYMTPTSSSSLLSHQQPVILSNGTSPVMPSTSSSNTGAWIASTGSTEISSNNNNINPGAGLFYSESGTGNPIPKSSSNGSGLNLTPSSGSSPYMAHHQRSTLYSNDANSSSTITTTPVSTYGSESNWTHNWTPPSASNIQLDLMDGGDTASCSGAWLPTTHFNSNNKGGAFQLRNKPAAGSRFNSKQQQRSATSGRSTTFGKNSSSSLSNGASSNKQQVVANKAAQNENAVNKLATAAPATPAPLTTAKPSTQQFAIIAKIFSAIGSVLFASSPSSRANSNRRLAAATPASSSTTATKSVDGFDGGKNDDAIAATKLKRQFLLDDDADDCLAPEAALEVNNNIARRRRQTTANSSRSSSSNSSSRNSSSFMVENGNNNIIINRDSSHASDNENNNKEVVRENNNADESVERSNKTSSSEVHFPPPSYESLLAGGDASSSSFHQQASGSKMLVMPSKMHDSNMKGRRRRAMTASAPTADNSNASNNNNNNNNSDLGQAAGSVLKNDTEMTKHLKAELGDCRQNEQDLRSQLGKLGIEQQSLRSDNVRLQKQNDSLEQRLHEIVKSQTREKKDAGAFEKRLQEESKKRLETEKMLERERRAHAKDLEDVHKRDVDAEKMRAKAAENEQDLLQLRQELKAREDDVRKLCEENRRLEQYRNVQKDTDVLLSALAAMQDKNMHMENSLTAETKLKLELFTALGDAKKELDQYKPFVLKRDAEIKELKDCIKRLSIAASQQQQQQQQQQMQQQPSFAAPLTSINSGNMDNNNTMSNGFGSSGSSGLLLNGSTGSKQTGGRLSLLDNPLHHKYDSLASALSGHFGGSSVSSSSPGFLHEYTSGSATTPPLGGGVGVSHGVNGVGNVGGGGGNSGLLFAELGYGNSAANSYYAAVQQGNNNNSVANRSTPSPSSVPGSSSATTSTSAGGAGHTRLSPSMNNNNNNNNGMGTSQFSSRCLNSRNETGQKLSSSVLTKNCCCC